MDENHDAVLIYTRACLAQKQKNYEQAIADFARVLELDPSFYNAAYAKASCESIIGRYEDAIETYNLAFAKDNDSPAQAHLALSSCRSSSRRGSPELHLRHAASRKRLLQHQYQQEAGSHNFSLHPMEIIPDLLSNQNNHFNYSTQQPNDAQIMPTLIVPSDILEQDQLDRVELFEEARNAAGGVATKMDEFQRSQ